MFDRVMKFVITILAAIGGLVTTESGNALSISSIWGRNVNGWSIWGGFDNSSLLYGGRDSRRGCRIYDLTFFYYKKNWPMDRVDRDAAE